MNFRVVLHLFLADVRRLRWLIALTFAAMLWELLPWLTSSPWRQPFVSGGSSGSIPPELLNWSGHRQILFTATAWCLAAATGWCGLIEARVRPVRTIETAAAKLLFLTLLLWLPQCLSLYLAHTRNGLSSGDALESMRSCAGVFVPLWIAALLTGRIARSRWHWGAALGIACAIGGFIALFQEKYAERLVEVLFDGWGHNCGPRAWYLLASSAAGLLLLAGISRHWKFPARSAALTAMLLGCGAIWHRTAWFEVAETVKDAALTPAVLESLKPVPGPDAAVTGGSVGEAPVLWVHHAFQTPGLPVGVTCFWRQAGEARLLRNGRTVALTKPRSESPGADSGDVPLREQVVSAVLATAFPGSSIAWQGGRHDLYSPDLRLDAFWPEPGEQVEDGASVALDARLRGFLVRHEIVINSEPGPAHIFSLNGMRISLRAAPIPKDPPQSGAPVNAGARPGLGADITVIAPATGRIAHSALLNWRHDFFHTARIFFYIPSREMLVEAGSARLFESGPVLGGAARWRRVIELDLSRMPDVSQADLTGVRIVVVAARILGVVERDLEQCAQFVPNLPVMASADLTGEGDFRATLGPNLRPVDFFASTRKVRLNPATATDDEFGAWLRTVLGPIILDDWQAAELARWVPGHLETLLNLDDGNSADPEVSAITAALPEQRKMEIISQIRERPELIQVLIDRGWLEDARSQLLSMFHDENLRTNELTCAVLLLRDPSTAEALLAKVEKDGGSWLCAQLRKFQGIEPRLTQAVERYYARVSLHGKAPGGKPGWKDHTRFEIFRTPLEHGIRGALEDVMALQHWLSSAPPGEPVLDLTEKLAYHIQLPSGTKRDSPAARDYFNSLRPEELHWDRLTRMWLRKPDKT